MKDSHTYTTKHGTTVVTGSMPSQKTQTETSSPIPSAPALPLTNSILSPEKLSAASQKIPMELKVKSRATTTTRVPLKPATLFTTDSLTAQSPSQQASEESTYSESSIIPSAILSAPVLRTPSYKAPSQPSRTFSSPQHPVTSPQKPAAPIVYNTNLADDDYQMHVKMMNQSFRQKRDNNSNPANDPSPSRPQDES